MKATVALLAALGVTALAPRPSHAQPAVSECFLRWHSAESGWRYILDVHYEFHMLHDRRRPHNTEKLAASLNKNLSTAAGRHTQAETCDRTPAFAAQVRPSSRRKLAALKAKAEAKRTAALSHAREARELLSLAGRANKLLADVRRDDGGGFDTLFAKAKAFDTEILAAMKKNPTLATQWHDELFSVIGRALGDNNKRRAATRAKLEAARLLEAAVVKKLPQFTAEDAFNPAKVQAAFEAVDPSDVVYLRKGSRSYYKPGKHDHYARVSRRSDIKAEAFVNNNDLAIYAIYNRAPGSAAEGTPGLLWNITDRNWAIFVAMDGGRYRVGLSYLTRGLSQARFWPKTPKHTVLLESDIPFLAERGVLPAKLAKRFTSADDKYTRCAKKIWKSKDRAFDRISAKNLLRRVRDERVRQLNRKVRSSIDRRCKRHRKTYTKTWKKALAIYSAKRKATLAAARSRLEKLANRTATPVGP